MKKVLCVGRVLLALVPFLTVSPVAQAVATWNRVFMSTTGDDTNNCSDPATPCRTFGGAQAQTNAGGEIIAMATGGYGQLTITQSVTINGPAGVVIFSNYPVTVNAPGATVVLRGLTIDGTGQTGNGIDVPAVGSLHVESCVITGWAADSTANNGTGIRFTSAGQLFVKDTFIRGNGYAGLLVFPASGSVQASVDHCRLESNFYGLFPTSNTQVTISNSIASGNSFGILLEGSDVTAEQCVIANNSVKGIARYAGTARISNCTVTGNAIGLFGTPILSRGNNTVEGNVTDGAFSGTYSAK
jgi:hypothetical protein